MDNNKTKKRKRAGKKTRENREIHFRIHGGRGGRGERGSGGRFNTGRGRSFGRRQGGRWRLRCQERADGGRGGRGGRGSGGRFNTGRGRSFGRRQGGRWRLRCQERAVPINAAKAHSIIEPTSINAAKAHSNIEPTSINAAKAHSTNEIAPINAAKAHSTNEIAPINAVKAHSIIEPTSINAAEAHSTIEIAPIIAAKAHSTNEIAPINAAEAHFTNETAPINAAKAHSTNEIAPTGADLSNIAVSNCPYGHGSLVASFANHPIEKEEFSFSGMPHSYGVDATLSNVPYGHGFLAASFPNHPIEKEEFSFSGMPHRYGVDATLSNNPYGLGVLAASVTNHPIQNEESSFSGMPHRYGVDATLSNNLYGLGVLAASVTNHPIQNEESSFSGMLNSYGCDATLSNFPYGHGDLMNAASFTNHPIQKEESSFIGMPHSYGGEATLSNSPYGHGSLAASFANPPIEKEESSFSGMPHSYGGEATVSNSPYGHGSLAASVTNHPIEKEESSLSVMPHSYGGEASLSFDPLWKWELNDNGGYDCNPNPPQIALKGPHSDGFNGYDSFDSLNSNLSDVEVDELNRDLVSPKHAELFSAFQKKDVNDLSIPRLSCGAVDLSSSVCDFRFPSFCPSSGDNLLPSASCSRELNCTNQLDLKMDRRDDMCRKHECTAEQGSAAEFFKGWSDEVLQKLCEERNLSSRGNRCQLIERLFRKEEFMLESFSKSVQDGCSNCSSVNTDSSLYLAEGSKSYSSDDSFSNDSSDESYDCSEYSDSPHEDSECSYSSESALQCVDEKFEEAILAPNEDTKKADCSKYSDSSYEDSECSYSSESSVQSVDEAFQEAILAANEETKKAHCTHSLQIFLCLHINPDAKVGKNKIPMVNDINKVVCMERPKTLAIHNDMLYSIHLKENTAHLTVTFEFHSFMMELFKKHDLLHQIKIEWAKSKSNKIVKGNMEVHYSNLTLNNQYHHSNISPKLLEILESHPDSFQTSKNNDRGTSLIFTKGKCRKSAKDVFKNTLYCCLSSTKSAVNTRKDDSTVGYPLVFSMLAVIGRIAYSFDDNNRPCEIQCPEKMSEFDYDNFYLPERIRCRKEMYKQLLCNVWDREPPQEFQILVRSVAASLGIQVNNTSSYESSLEDLVLFLPENMAIRWISNVLIHCDQMNCQILTRTLGYLLKFYPHQLPLNSKIRREMEKDCEHTNYNVKVSIGGQLQSNRQKAVTLSHQYILLAGYLRKCVHKDCLRYTFAQSALRNSEAANDICVLLLYEVFVYFRGKSLDYNQIVRSDTILMDTCEEQSFLLPPTLDPMSTRNDILHFGAFLIHNQALKEHVDVFIFCATFAIAPKHGNLLAKLVESFEVNDFEGSTFLQFLRLQSKLVTVQDTLGVAVYDFATTNDDMSDVSKVFKSFCEVDEVRVLKSLDQLELFQVIACFGLIPIEFAEYANVSNNDVASHVLKSMYGDDTDCESKFHDIFNLFETSFHMHVPRSILYKCLLFLHSTIIQNDEARFSLQNLDLEVIRAVFKQYEEDIYLTKDLWETHSYDQQSKCPCHIFYFLNGRLKLRESISSTSIYVGFNYDDQNSAKFFALKKKGGRKFKIPFFRKIRV